MLTALFLPVCVPQCLSQTAQGRDHLSDTISGTVLNSVTREPISRALVYTWDRRSAAFTDQHGHFELILAVTADVSDPRARAQIHERLQARKPGFVTEQARYGSIEVSPGQDDAILLLVPEALIVGHVKFPSAEAADHVQVQLYRREVRNGFGRWAPQSGVTTHADGEFRFADLDPGEYKVSTLETTEQDPLANVPNGPAFGFRPRYFAAARDFASADTIRVRAGETITADIAPERMRYYDVKVPVVSAEPVSPQGLEVWVYAQGHRGPGFALAYDPNQRAIRGSLPNGSFTVEAASFRPGAATGVANITVANGPLNAPPLTMAPNVSIEINVRRDVTAGDIPQGAGNVHVTLESAEEFVEGGSGRNYQAEGNPPALVGVAPGRYWVQVNPSGPAGMYFPSVTSGPKDLLRTPLVVPFGASVPPIEITVRYDAALIEATIEGTSSGTVAGSTSGAVVSSSRSGSFQLGGGPAVYCIPLDGGRVREFSDQFGGGIYVLAQIPPGDYRILAFDSPQQLEYRNAEAMRAYESKGKVVHVTPGQKLQVQLQPIRSE